MLTVILHLKYKHITITGIKSSILLKEQYLVRGNQQTSCMNKPMLCLHKNSKFSMSLKKC